MKLIRFSFFIFFFLLTACSSKQLHVKKIKNEKYFILNNIYIKTTPDLWQFTNQPYESFFTAISANKKIIAYGNVYKIKNKPPVIYINYIIKNKKIIQINKKAFFCKKIKNLKNKNKIVIGECIFFRKKRD